MTYEEAYELSTGTCEDCVHNGYDKKRCKECSDAYEIALSLCKNADKSMQWEKVLGLWTPGGDPCYICPNCHDKDSKHISGIECYTHWNFCPVCGTRLKY